MDFNVEIFLFNISVMPACINFPDVNRSTMTGHIQLSTYFCELKFEFNLEQQVTEPTHKGGNLLDVILTNTNCI